MNKDLVSTIIPNYNNAPYIKDCVNSLLAQSYDNMEIIIADDASTDGSQDVIAQLVAQHNHVHAIYNSHNIGITRNRKQAIQLAQGEYLNYLDSDDYIQNPDKLEAEMEIIQYYRKKYAEDVIAFSDVAIANGKGEIVNRFRDIRPVREGYITAELMTRRCLIPQNFTFRRDLYDAVCGHDETIPFYENWDLKIRLSAKHPYIFTGVPGFVYRRHGEGLSNQNEALHHEWVRRIAEKNLVLIDEFEQPMVKRWIEQMLLQLGDELNFINSHLQKQGVQG
ncbi:glycosyltransferase [Paenibacillus sp. N1-5-1-14]|uniref:glycosyltransferase family 2 protein n=1 Tax=Paenibacillus radicibacter TaxID=2972488 RepID=UPI0021593AFC|nr:glycosyltransferase family 2 protein [Paenibacillus radicibacter]MCR8645163.1 glycosyltransferase [Paenibacillus radicibacter]